MEGQMYGKIGCFKTDGKPETGPNPRLPIDKIRVGERWDHPKASSTIHHSTIHYKSYLCIPFQKDEQ